MIISFSYPERFHWFDAKISADPVDPLLMRLEKNIAEDHPSRPLRGKFSHSVFKLRFKLSEIDFPLYKRNACQFRLDLEINTVKVGRPVKMDQVGDVYPIPDRKVYSKTAVFSTAPRCAVHWRSHL
jgi:hypothetical protein